MKEEPLARETRTIRKVNAQHKVKVEASTNQKIRQTTFHVKAETQKELDKAKRSLLSLLSPVVRISALRPGFSHVAQSNV